MELPADAFTRPAPEVLGFLRPPDQQDQQGPSSWSLPHPSLVVCLSRTRPRPHTGHHDAHTHSCTPVTQKHMHACSYAPTPTAAPESTRGQPQTNGPRPLASPTVSVTGGPPPPLSFCAFFAGEDAVALEKVPTRRDDELARAVVRLLARALGGQEKEVRASLASVCLCVASSRSM